MEPSDICTELTLSIWNLTFEILNHRPEGVRIEVSKNPASISHFMKQLGLVHFVDIMNSTVKIPCPAKCSPFPVTTAGARHDDVFRRN
jgi:hypothetical protein